MEALAEELPVDTIRFSSKLKSIVNLQAEEGSSYAIIHMENGVSIKAKVNNILSTLLRITFSLITWLEVIRITSLSGQNGQMAIKY